MLNKHVWKVSQYPEHEFENRKLEDDGFTKNMVSIEFGLKAESSCVCILGGEINK